MEHTENKKNRLMKYRPTIITIIAIFMLLAFLIHNMETQTMRLIEERDRRDMQIAELKREIDSLKAELEVIKRKQ